jgi:predicted transcriptional regulator
MRKWQESKTKKLKILDLIVKSPGIQYRQLLRCTGLSNGSLSYILKDLKSSKQIVVNRLNNKKIIANLTSNIDRKIVQFLLKQEKCTFRDIVTPMHKAPSTVSWHLSRLRDANIIMSVRYNNGRSIYKTKE